MLGGGAVVGVVGVAGAVMARGKAAGPGKEEPIIPTQQPDVVEQETGSNDVHVV